MKVFNTCIYCLPDYGQRVYMGSLALRAHCMQNSKFSETVTKSVRLSWVSISTTVHSRFYHRIWLDWKPVINLWGIIAQFYGPLFCLCLRQSVRADQIRCLQLKILSVRQLSVCTTYYTCTISSTINRERATHKHNHTANSRDLV